MYAELDKLTGRMQNRLQTLGIKPGDRVMVQVGKSPEAIILYLACLRAGAIYIPLNTAYTTAEVDYFVDDANPHLFVCQPEKLDTLSPVFKRHHVSHAFTLDTSGGGSLLTGMDEFDTDPAVVNRSDKDLAAILYTSGTTGRSKGAMLSHGNLQSNAEILHSYWHWRDDSDVLLHALPIFHVHGLFVALHCALLGASPVNFLPRFDITDVIEKLPDCTVMMGIPTFYTRLLGIDDFTADACSGMRLFISGSAPLAAETHREFETRTGHRILERYGMTETGMITSNPYHGERKAGTVGFALPGVKVRIADENGAPLPAGKVGVLELSGENVFQGYWQMAEKTAQDFRADGWFITGDIAVMDDSGRISIVGRARDMIISGGYNIYPKEIEVEINALESVKESAVFGVPHPDFGEGVMAVVVANDRHQPNETEIMDSLQGKLARFKQPRHIDIIAELPRNSMGKVQKEQLRKTYQTRFSSYEYRP